MLILEIIIGGLFAAAILYLLHFEKEDVLKGVLTISLVVAALIYVFFAFFGLWTNSANLNWLLIEIVGFGIYFLFAFLGVKRSVWFLAIGWTTHVLWDVVVHFSQNSAFVPDFYPPVCIGFDLVFATYIYWRFRLLERKNG